MSAPVDCEFGPPVAFPPPQLPVALQLVAFVDDQVSVEAEPTATNVGEAERETVGIGETQEKPSKISGATQVLHVGGLFAPLPHDGAAPTPTVTDCIREGPPGPVHWNWNKVSAMRGLVNPLPGPRGEEIFDHGPYAVQLVAFVDDHVSVERPPYTIGFGEAVSVARGASGGLTATVTLASVPP